MFCVYLFKACLYLLLGLFVKTLLLFFFVYIEELTDIEKLHQQNFDALTDKIYSLQNQKNKLEQFVFRFRNSNKKYLKIKSVAEEVVDRLLAKQGGLLTSALLAVVESLRLNPDRYAVIYNTKYDETMTVVVAQL